MFDENYYFSNYPDVAKSRISPLRHYIECGWAENRNPCAEFDTWFYNTEYNNLSRYPGGGLLHYILHGQARGLKSRPKNSITIKNGEFDYENPSDCLGSIRVAVHAHIFYPDMAEDFANALESMPINYDLYVSTTSHTNADFLEKLFSRLLKNVKVEVRCVENRGRDIAPLFVEFAAMWQHYDYVCHIHSKRSAHTEFGDNWRRYLFDALFGSKEIILSVLSYMCNNPKCGIIFPDNYHRIKQFTMWGDNEDHLLSFLRRLGCQVEYLPRFAHFAAGSMCWIRPGAINNLLCAGLSLADFEPEGGQLDFTLAHVIERALPLIAIDAGFNITSYYLENPPHLRISKKLYSSTVYSDPVGRRWKRDTSAIAIHEVQKVQPRTMLFNRSCLDINWIIPDFALGAGGHMTIFRFVEFLGNFGHRQTIWIQNARNHESPAAAKRVIQRHYRPISESVAVRYLPDDVSQISGDVVIATDCWTVFPAVTATDIKERFYFVQDFEPMFYPMGENHLTALLTYRMGLRALCAGNWLLSKAQEHKMWARNWSLASDPNYYYPNGRRIHNELELITIAYYCRSYTPRRAVNLGFAAFGELERRGMKFEVFLFGEDARPRDLAFKYCDLGVLAPQELGELYRKCDIGVVFSTTNYSLVPLEMMACGLPTVELDTESIRAEFPPGVAKLAAPNPRSVADAIMSIANDGEQRKQMAKRAYEFVSQLSWKQSAQIVEQSIIEGLIESNFSPIDPAKVCALQPSDGQLGTTKGGAVIRTAASIRRKRHVSVVIPSYNGGALFARVLERVMQQKTSFFYDVLVIDSSSSDQTSENIKRSGARCHIIEKSEFQHGKTRNLGISMTDGDFIAILTQDSLPENDNWLENLVGGFRASDRVAGVIGRHIAYPEHSPFVARDLESLFQRLSDFGEIYALERDLPSFIYRGGIEWRMIMHFYSDNNSAMSRAVWNELPYPEITWGEDQVWCWQALRLGFHKAYRHDAVVYHSHCTTPSEQLETAAFEGSLFAREFGYDLYPSAEAARTELKDCIRRERDYALRNGISVDMLDQHARLLAARVEGHIQGGSGRVRM